MLISTPLADLATNLHLGDNELVSLVGGGGKTTSLFRLGSQLRGRVVLTTTTKMGSERTGEIPVLIRPDLPLLVEHIQRESPLLVWENVDGRMALGVQPETCDTWFGSPMVDSVVVEADGSRKRPFKAPLAYEPVVPSRTTVLIACIGAGALGQVIAECCQRPDRVAALADCATSDILTPERAAAVLTHQDGSMKARPENARFVVAAHRVEPGQQEMVERLAEAVSEIDPTTDVLAVEATTAV